MIGLFLLFSCNSQHDIKKFNLKEQVYRQSQRILNDHDEKVWNLKSIDTADIKVYKGRYTSANDTALFISISGEVEEASGNGLVNRLNLLGHVHDSLIVDYYEQGVLPDTIIDLDNDGVEDFYFKFSVLSMGTCVDNYLIKTFLNKKETVLFKRHDESVLDCGGFREESVKFGDTLSTSRSIMFHDNDKAMKPEIIITSEFKICNGGKNEKDIIDSLKTIESIDTIRINKD